MSSVIHKSAPELIREPRVIMTPGVFDALSALLVQRAGFELAFLSGAALSFSRFGRPDLGLTTLSELSEATRTICDRMEIGLLVDADTGFGNALNVQRTVRELERAGAAGIVLEDQLAPKRCGHMQGKQVIAAGEMAGKVRAALDARRHDTLIIARTDALAVEGLDAALERAELYLAQGADALFIEGPRSVEQMQAIAERFGGRAPLLHNMVEGGGTPLATAAELEPYAIRIALYPAMLVHMFATQAPKYLARLAAHGGTSSFGHELSNLTAMNDLLGAAELLDDSQRYA